LAFDPMEVSAGATKLRAQLARNLIPRTGSKLAAILGFVVLPKSL
jgi:hypothetical protein